MNEPSIRGILSHNYINASDDIAAYHADRCKRQAVTVEWAYEHLCDETLYVYDEEAGKLGLDPWITIDAGVDMNPGARKYILCYGRTGEKIVDGNFRVFASKKSILAVR